MSAYRQLLDFVKARRAAGLSDETLLVLLHLHAHGASTRLQIAEACAINPTTLPRYLAWLARHGKLVKSRSADDQREVMLDLSVAGRALVTSLLAQFPVAPP